VNVKKSIVLSLSDEDLFELERIMLDNDGKGALKVLKKYLEHEVNAVISGEGHRKPWFELPGRSIIYKSDSI
jgi:hypothetical protein